MKNKYIDLVGQTFDFPQDEFRVDDGRLFVNDIDMMKIIKEYGTPVSYPINSPFNDLIRFHTFAIIQSHLISASRTYWYNH